MKALPSYATAADAWVAAVAVGMMHANGKQVWPEVDKLSRRRA